MAKTLSVICEGKKYNNMKWILILIWGQSCHILFPLKHTTVFTLKCQLLLFHQMFSFHVSFNFSCLIFHGRGLIYQDQRCSNNFFCSFRYRFQPILSNDPMKVLFEKKLFLFFLNYISYWPWMAVKWPWLEHHSHFYGTFSLRSTRLHFQTFKWTIQHFQRPTGPGHPG